MILNEKKGNLFELDKKYALAHCVSLDCDNPKSWGMGIAVEFNKRFRGMKKHCANQIKDKNLSFPCTIPFKGNDRIVFNLITKKVYYGKPTYITIRSCIKQMAFMCDRHNIKYLAIPKLGSGLDKLQWGKVREIIEEEFKDLNIEIEVRCL